MRAIGAVLIVIAAIGFFAAANVIRGLPREDDFEFIMSAFGAVFVPFILLLVGVVFWERGKPKPPGLG